MLHPSDCVLKHHVWTRYTQTTDYGIAEGVLHQNAVHSTLNSRAIRSDLRTSHR